MRNDAGPPPQPRSPRRIDRIGTTPARGLTVWLLLAVLGLGPVGCTTAQMSAPPSTDALERIPPGTRVRITTRDGDTLRLKVVTTSAETLEGRDRYFRRHEVPRERMEDIEAPPQNDWVVALLFFTLVFVART